MEAVDILAEELFFNLASVVGEREFLNGTLPSEYRELLLHEIGKDIEYLAARLDKDPEVFGYYNAWRRAEDRFDELYERLPYPKVYHETYSQDMYINGKESEEYNDSFDIFLN